jgi:hypothetical protein
MTTKGIVDFESQTCPMKFKDYDRFGFCCFKRKIKVFDGVLIFRKIVRAPFGF